MMFHAPLDKYVTEVIVHPAQDTLCSVRSDTIVLQPLISLPINYNHHPIFFLEISSERGQDRTNPI